MTPSTQRFDQLIGQVPARKPLDAELATTLALATTAEAQLIELAALRSSAATMKAQLVDYRTQGERRNRAQGSPCETSLAAARRKVAALRESLSWKITRPVRLVKRMFSRNRRDWPKPARLGEGR